MTFIFGMRNLRRHETAMADRHILKFAAAVFAAVVVAAAPASAQTATANLTVSANVNNNCTISTAPLAFGTYDPVGTHAAADLDATGTVTIACTRGVAATIGLGLGGYASGAIRRMSDGAGNYLVYEMY